MRRLFSYLVMAACIVATYQGYENAQLRSNTHELAKQVACGIDSSCLLNRQVPSEARTDPLRRRYQWSTTIGPVLVTCKRKWIFFGEWSCESKQDKFGHF